MNPTNLWAFTALGAADYLAVRRSFAQYQAIISAMSLELDQVKRQLASLPSNGNTGLLTK